MFGSILAKIEEILDYFSPAPDGIKSIHTMGLDGNSYSFNLNEQGELTSIQDDAGNEITPAHPMYEDLQTQVPVVLEIAKEIMDDIKKGKR